MPVAALLFGLERARHDMPDDLQGILQALAISVPTRAALLADANVSGAEPPSLGTERLDGPLWPRKWLRLHHQGFALRRGRATAGERFHPKTRSCTPWRRRRGIDWQA